MARILFVLTHGGIIAHLEETIKSLAQNGHFVHVLCRSTSVDPVRKIDRLRNEYDKITLDPGRAKRRNDVWSAFARYTRSIRDYSMYFLPDYVHASSLRERAAAKLGAEV